MDKRDFLSLSGDCSSNCALSLPNSPSSVLRLPFVAWDKSAGLAISFWQVFHGFCNFWIKYLVQRKLLAIPKETWVSEALTPTGESGALSRLNQGVVVGVNKCSCCERTSKMPFLHWKWKLLWRHKLEFHWDKDFCNFGAVKSAPADAECFPFPFF